MPLNLDQLISRFRTSDASLVESENQLVQAAFEAVDGLGQSRQVVHLLLFFGSAVSGVAVGLLWEIAYAQSSLSAWLWALGVSIVWLVFSGLLYAREKLHRPWIRLEALRAHRLAVMNFSRDYRKCVEDLDEARKAVQANAVSAMLVEPAGALLKAAQLGAEDEFVRALQLFCTSLLGSSAIRAGARESELLVSFFVTREWDDAAEKTFNETASNRGWAPLPVGYLSPTARYLEYWWDFWCPKVPDSTPGERYWPIRIGEYLFGECLQRRKWVYKDKLDEVHADARRAPEAYSGANSVAMKVGSGLAVPINSAKECIGVLGVFSQVHDLLEFSLHDASRESHEPNRQFLAGLQLLAEIFVLYDEREVAEPPP